MPTQQQLDAMNAVKQKIASGQGASLNAQTDSWSLANKPTQPSASQIVKPPSIDAGSSMQSTAGPGQALQQTKPLPPLSTSSVPSPTTQQPSQGPTQAQKDYIASQQSTINSNQNLDPDAIARDPNGYKQFQQKAAAAGYNYDNNGKLIPNQSTQPKPTDNFKVEDKNAFDTQDAQINGQIAQTQSQAQTYQDQSKVLEQSNTQDQTQLRQDLVVGAQQTYQAENQNLDALAQKAADALTQKNAAAQSESEADKQAAADQYQRDTAALEAQRARSNQAYQHQIVQQNVANTQRVLEEESRIASLGGFGSLTSFRERKQLTLQNDETMNNLVFLKDQADRETTDRVQATSQQYTTSLNKIEADKQQAVSDNYDKYVDFVKGVTQDKNKTETEKFDTIKQAAEDYTKNVADIHNTAFNARYAAADKSAVDARAIYQQHQQDLRANAVPTSFTDNAGNVTTVYRDARTGKVISQDTMQSIGAALPPTAQFDSVTGMGYIWDPVTKKIISLGGADASGNVFPGTPGGYSPSGDTLLPNDSLNSIFKINKKGYGDGSKNDGQCGHSYNYLTDGPKVGDTWASKMKATSIQPTEADGTNVDLRPGMGIALPLLVSTDGKGTGHMATLLHYDKSTGDMQYVQSNMDGKGTNTIGYANIKTWEQKYKNKDGSPNFGFTNSTFKSSIQSQLDKATLPYGAPQQGNQTTQPTSQDLPGTNPQVLQGQNQFIQQAIRDISQGKYTVDTYPYAPSQPGMPSGMKTVVANLLSKYDPSYNETLRTANAGSLQQANTTLAQMTGMENSAKIGLNQLIGLQAKLPQNKSQYVNNIENIISTQFNNPDKSTFDGQLVDTLKQVNAVLNSGNQGTEADIQGLAKTLNVNQDNAAFKGSINGMLQAMSNKMEGQKGVVNTLATGGNLGKEPAQNASPVDIKSAIQKAKEVGRTSEQIIASMKTHPEFQIKIQNAMDAGLNPDDILNYMSQ